MYILSIWLILTYLILTISWAFALPQTYSRHIQSIGNVYKDLIEINSFKRKILNTFKPTNIKFNNKLFLYHVNNDTLSSIYNISKMMIEESPFLYPDLLSVKPIYIEVLDDEYKGIEIKEEYHLPSVYMKYEAYLKGLDAVSDRLKLLNDLGIFYYDLINNFNSTFTRITSCLYIDTAQKKIKVLSGYNCLIGINWEDRLSGKYSVTFRTMVDHFISSIFHIEMDSIDSSENYRVDLMENELTNSLQYDKPLSCDETGYIFNMLVNSDTSSLVLNPLFFEVSVEMINVKDKLIFLKLLNLCDKSDFVYNGFHDFFNLNGFDNKNRADVIKVESNDTDVIIKKLLDYGISFPDLEINYRIGFEDVVFSFSEKSFNPKYNLEFIDNIDEINVVLRPYPMFLLPILITDIGFGKVGYNIAYDKFQEDRIFYTNIRLDTAFLNYFSVYREELTFLAYKNMISVLAELESHDIILTPFYAVLGGPDWFAINPLVNSTDQHSVLVDLYKTLRCFSTMPNLNIYSKINVDTFYEFSVAELELFDYLHDRKYKDALKSFISIGEDMLGPLKFKFKEFELSDDFGQLSIYLDMNAPTKVITNEIDKITPLLQINRKQINLQQRTIMLSSSLQFAENDFIKYARIVESLTINGWYFLSFFFVEELSGHLSQKYEVEIHNILELFLPELFRKKDIISRDVRTINYICLITSMVGVLDQQQIEYEILKSFAFSFFLNYKYVNGMDDLIQLYNILSFTQHEKFRSLNVRGINSSEILNRIYNIMKYSASTNGRIEGKNMFHAGYKNMIKSLFQSENIDVFLDQIKNILKKDVLNIEPTKENLEFFINSKMLVQENCSICREETTEDEYDSTLMIHTCRQGFHNYCINEWLKVAGTCPLCREEMN